LPEPGKRVPPVLLRVYGDVSNGLAAVPVHVAPAQFVPEYRLAALRAGS
jgi:hypothetical protein